MTTTDRSGRWGRWGRSNTATDPAGPQARGASSLPPACEAGIESDLRPTGPPGPVPSSADFGDPPAGLDALAAGPDEPTAGPDRPTAEPDEPTAGPDRPTAEPDEPTAGPDEPTAGPDEPADVFVPPADPANLEPVDLLSDHRANGARIRLLGYPADRVPAEWRNDLPMECTTYHNAFAMPIASADDSSRQLIGALYAADGTLIAESQRAKTNLTWSDNPERLRRKPGLRTELLEGRTYFAGHYRSIFGHLLLEILPRFWPDLDYAAYDTLLFHPQRAGRRASHLLLEPYGDDLLAAATGGSQADLRIVAGRPLRLAEVTVATPGVWLKDGFSPAARIAFDRVADRLIDAAGSIDASRPTKLYLSRSRLHSRHRRAENEADIEDLMTSAGFTVVHPQTLSVGEQVALVRSADVLAGCDGSALHLAVFARPGTRVVAFDSRPVPNQFLVEHLAGIDAVHVLAGADRAVHGRADTWRASLPLVRAALEVAAVD